ncbi:TolC family protein [Corallococcus praedator]|uniref:TolC family protein n=1 Tax=Corallococcus praedator TaxID=2316724 RepID=A0ABX9Q696_9BACT|nr:MULTISPECIES: TolC family protein [Corallococcus]RKH16793.1 TolC family protein [Corallococcus sp. CA047B]RKH18733.1 TolC family protein [Corallococcus sp. CA031C]RKH91880.1 TolC family protein [Corallococcus praedator]
MSTLLALSLSAALAAAPVLSLDEALESARQQNLDLKIAQERFEQASLATRKAWAGYLPTISVGASITRNNVAAIIPAGTIAPVDITIQPLIQQGAQAEIRQAIIAPQLWAGIAASYKSVKLAELNTQTARRQVLFGVAQAYYGAAAQQEALRAQERLLELTRAREKDTQARFDAGTVTRVALLRAQLDRSRAEQDLVRAKNALAGLKLALGTLIQKEPDFDLAPPPEPQVPAQASPDDLVNQAIQERSDVQAAEVGLKLTRINKTGVILSYLPTLGVTGAYRIANAAGFTGQNETWAITFGASWTLFDGGLREANLSEASSRVREATVSQQLAQARVKEEVRRSKLDLENALANRSKAEEALGLARESNRLTDVSFQAGVATYLEVADANTSLTNAEVGFVSERLQASLAALRLLNALGSFESGSVRKEAAALGAKPGAGVSAQPQQQPAQQQPAPEQQPAQQPAPQQ